MADGDGFGDTPTMTSLPPATLYHRWMGWHASSMRRAVVVTCIGLLVALVLVWLVTWELAVIAGWVAAAFTFLLSVWPIIIGADSSHAAQLASREDESRGSATLLLVASSMTSLLGAGFVLDLAGQNSGPPRVLFIGVAVLTVVLSWTVVNTVYTLRYADLHYRLRGVGHRLWGGGRPGAAHLPRLRLCRLHHRHDLPGVRYHGGRSQDPTHRARPRLRARLGVTRQAVHHKYAGRRFGFGR